MKFERDTAVDYGVLKSVAPNIRRITANNPSAFTFTGTNSYVVGEGDVAVVDPGPLDPAHIDALLRSLSGETVTHILVTHTHADHSSACGLLQQATSAPIYAYEIPVNATVDFDESADESADVDFKPDRALRDGQIVEGGNWALECVFTPGHMLNHLCFALIGESELLSGDHVMGWSTSIVSPPEGHMGSYLKSLERLLSRDEQRYWPGHGGVVSNPKEYVRDLINHRRAREEKVLGCIASGLNTVDKMISTVYADVDKSLYPAAARSLYATVINLVEENRLMVGGKLTIQSTLQLA